MRRWLAGRRVAASIAALTVVLTVATGSWLNGPRPPIRGVVATGLSSVVREHNVLSLLTSVLITNGPAELLVVVAVLLTVLGTVERLVGHLRLGLLYLVTAVVGTLSGLVLQAAGLFARDWWSTPPSRVEIVDPFTPIAGTLLAASAFAGPLWRRRIRVLGLAGLVVVLLYSGQPADLYRLAAAVVGLVLGQVLVHRRPTLTWPRSSHHEARSLASAVVAVTAVGPVVALLGPHGYGVLRPLGFLFRDPLPSRAALAERCGVLRPAVRCARQLALARLNSPGAVVLSPLPLLVLLVAAVAMWRGRRIAALAAIAVEGVLAVLAGIYYGLLPTLVDADQLVAPGTRGPTLQGVLAMLVPLGAAITVAVTLRHFDVAPSRRALTGLLVASGGTFVVLSALYVGLGSTVLRAQFSPRPSLTDLLVELPERFVPVGFLRERRPDFVPVGPEAHLLWGWIGPITWAVVLIGLLVAAAGSADAARSGELERLRGLLRIGSTGSLGHMATWPGTRTWFSPDGRHAVAYRENSGVAIALGEPIGPPGGAAEAARAFAVDCDDRGVTPAFYAVRPEFAGRLGTRRWHSVVIGEDTVLHPSTFSLTGKRWQDVRSSFNRAERQGIRAEWTDWERCSLATRTQIEAISEEWVAEKRLPELGFTIGGVDELRDRDVKLMLAIGPEERVEAVTSWLPTWRDGEVVGLTLDFMRRRSKSMNGVVEFLIASVTIAARDRGIEFVSLSAAPLATGIEEDEATRLDRLLSTLARILEPAYGFKSLAAFKEKFQPTLEPLVMAYPDALALPGISVALTREYLPGLSVQKIVRLVGALR